MAKITDTPGYTTMPNQPSSGGSGKVTDMPGYTTMPNKPSPSGPKPLGPKTPGYTTLPNKAPSGAGDFTKPAPNPFKPQQGVRPATPADRGNSPSRLSGVIGKVGDYLGNIKRSAQDVPTALGTALDTRGAMAAGTNGMPSGTAPIKNLATQIGQVGSSVLGKRDTSRSSQFYGPNKLYIDTNTDKGFFLNNPAKLKPPKG